MDWVINFSDSTLHNPRVSEEAKRHAQETLDNELQGDKPRYYLHEQSNVNKEPNRVAGGLKAWAFPELPISQRLLTHPRAMHNPSVSEDAKESAQERLGQMSNQTWIITDGINPRHFEDWIEWRTPSTLRPQNCVSMCVWSIQQEIDRLFILLCSYCIIETIKYRTLFIKLIIYLWTSFSITKLKGTSSIITDLVYRQHMCSGCHSIVILISYT